MWPNCRPKVGNLFFTTRSSSTCTAWRNPGKVWINPPIQIPEARGGGGTEWPTYPPHQLQGQVYSRDQFHISCFPKGRTLTQPIKAFNTSSPLPLTPWESSLNMRIREVRMIYRGPGFHWGRTIRLLVHSLPPSTVSNLSLFISFPLCHRSSVMTG
jgi:hypothetical protein